MLFFGNIARYKGLDYLVTATTQLLEADRTYCLIIVGRPKGDSSHWNRIKQAIEDVTLRDRIIQRIEYIPDEETEIYFKAADVLVAAVHACFPKRSAVFRLQLWITCNRGRCRVVKGRDYREEDGFDVYKPRTRVRLRVPLKSILQAIYFGSLNSVDNKFENTPIAGLLLDYSREHNWRRVFEAFAC